MQIGRLDLSDFNSPKAILNSMVIVMFVSASQEIHLTVTKSTVKFLIFMKSGMWKVRKIFILNFQKEL